MIYVFSFTIIYTFIRQREKILSKKRNFALYLLFSLGGLALGIVYILNPYLPSLTTAMEKYMK
jgi:membrane associated rhomboid family serine protease